jgi:hypothetical protein
VAGLCEDGLSHYGRPGRIDGGDTHVIEIAPSLRACKKLPDKFHWRVDYAGRTTDVVHSCTLLGFLMGTGQAYALGGSEGIVNWIPEDGSRVARMPTLATMRLSRRWGTQIFEGADLSQPSQPSLSSLRN